jgi:signal recognition particle GTPase
VVSTAGAKAGEIASKAKTPLLAGGAAVAGLAGIAAGGIAMKNRNSSRNPLKKIGTPSIPKSVKKFDLDTVSSTAKRVGKIGQQVGDVAEAAEKARKKSK